MEREVSSEKNYCVYVGVRLNVHEYVGVCLHLYEDVRRNNNMVANVETCLKITKPPNNLETDLTKTNTSGRAPGLSALRRRGGRNVWINIHICEVFEYTRVCAKKCMDEYTYVLSI